MSNLNHFIFENVVGKVFFVVLDNKYDIYFALNFYNLLTKLLGYDKMVLISTEKIQRCI